MKDNRLLLIDDITTVDMIVFSYKNKKNENEFLQEYVDAIEIKKGNEYLRHKEFFKKHKCDPLDWFLSSMTIKFKEER